MIPDFLDRRYVVYRVYCEDDSCLYVGMTRVLQGRMTQHQLTGVWFPLAARVRVTIHPDKESAGLVEMQQIGELRPRFNIRGRRPRPEWSACDFAEVIEIYRHTTGTTERRQRVVELFKARYPEIARQVLAAMAS